MLRLAHAEGASSANAPPSSPASKRSIIVANLLPLFGVLFLGWSAFSVVALYWAENVAIGVINVLKMIACGVGVDDAEESILAAAGDELSAKERAKIADSLTEMRRTMGGGMLAAKLFLIPFFTVHFGFFCFVHGVFVFVLLGDDDRFARGMSVHAVWRRLADEGLLWAVAALAAGHLVSFLVDYLGRGEYRRTSLMKLMIQPYGRIALLHVTLLAGGFLIAFMNSPKLLLVLFVLAKTAAELKLLGFQMLNVKVHRSQS